MEPNFPINSFSNLYQYVQPSMPSINRPQVYLNNGNGVMNVHNNMPQHYDVDMQNQMMVLKNELKNKNEEIAKLKAENTELKSKLVEKDIIIDSSWDLMSQSELATELFNRYNKFKEYYVTLFERINVDTALIRDSLPSKSPEVLAIMDGLYGIKGNNKFRIEAKCMLSHLGKDEVDRLTDYIETVEYDSHLATVYSRYIGGISHPHYNLLLSLLVSNHILRPKRNVQLNNIVDVMAIKYNNALDSNVSNLKVDFCDDDVEGTDYIYNRHSISGIQLSMLHSFSHMDYAIKGIDIAQYHVGKACRMSECSLIEVLDENNITRFFKPIKCSNEYVILPRLPNEKHYRVEAILHRNGYTPITLVRTINEKYSTNLVMGPISQEVNGLMNRVKLSNFSFSFSEEGLCITASGQLRPSNQRELDRKRKNCCNKAFRYNGVNQRQHKPLSLSI